MIPIIILFFILGAAVGSFLNVVAYRTVHGGSIFFDHSACPHCKKKLKPLDLVPILSYFLLKGRCRYCGEKISPQYPLVEPATGTFFALSFLHWYSINSINFINSINLIHFTHLIYLLFVAGVLIVLFTTDIIDGLLPNSVVLSSVAFVLILKSSFLVNGDITLSSLIIYFAAA